MPVPKKKEGGVVDKGEETKEEDPEDKIPIKGSLATVD